MKRLLGPLLALLVIALTAPFMPSASALDVMNRDVTNRQRASVPWDEVGDGWMLTTITRAPGGQGRPKVRTLELVSPEGARFPLYAATKRPAKSGGGQDRGNFTLIDWDPTTRVALLKRVVTRSREQAVRLDLQSGSSQSLRLPWSTASAGLRPDGAGVLTQTRGGAVISIAWDGTRTVIGRAQSLYGPLVPPDGTAAVFAGIDQLTVLPLDGSPTREITTPEICRPQRWYDDTQLLASCFSRMGTQLVTVTLDGTITPRAGLRATAESGSRGPSRVDTDVRVAGGRTYFEGNRLRGGPFITRENALGQDEVVTVPGSRGGVSLLDARDDGLVIAHTATSDAGPSRGVLALFDPVSGAEDVLLTLGRRERWGRLVVWDEARPWSW